MDRKMISLKPENPIAHYNLACSLALTEQNSEAVSALRTCLQKGYKDFDWMLEDSDLNNLRDYEPYVALLKEYNIPIPSEP